MPSILLSKNPESGDYTLRQFGEGPIKVEELFSHLEELKGTLRLENPDVRFKEDSVPRDARVGHTTFRRGIKTSTILNAAMARATLAKETPPPSPLIPPPAFLSSVAGLLTHIQQESSPSMDSAVFWIDLLSRQCVSFAQATEAQAEVESIRVLRDIWATTLHLFYHFNKEAGSSPSTYWISSLLSKETHSQLRDVPTYDLPETDKQGGLEKAIHQLAFISDLIETLGFNPNWEGAKILQQLHLQDQQQNTTPTRTGLDPEHGPMLDLATPGELAFYDYAVQQHCQATLDILDGKDTGAGANNEPWANVRSRLLVFRDDSEEHWREVQNLRKLASTCYAGLGAECNLPEKWLDALAAAADGFIFSTDGLIPFKADPIDMVLHCPKCGMQHIDAPSEDAQYLKDHNITCSLDQESSQLVWSDGVERETPWNNPPHKSHLCQNPLCKNVWRPADVATNGVESINTRGDNDTPLNSTPQERIKRNQELAIKGMEDLPVHPELFQAIAATEIFEGESLVFEDLRHQSPPSDQRRRILVRPSDGAMQRRIEESRKARESRTQSTQVEDDPSIPYRDPSKSHD